MKRGRGGKQAKLKMSLGLGVATVMKRERLVHRGGEGNRRPLEHDPELRPRRHVPWLM